MSGRAQGDLAETPLDELLRRLSPGEAGAHAARAEILRRTVSIIDEVIAESFPTSGFPSEDLFRSGYLGLLNAVCNFDLSRGKTFREYAESLIKGEIRQHIRERAKRMSIPGWMKDLNRQLETAEARLLRESGQLPTLKELAEAVNITEEGIAEIFKAREALSYVSLDAGQRRKDPLPEIDVSKIRGLRSVPFPIEHRVKIASALEKLAELQQHLFHSLFLGETS